MARPLSVNELVPELQFWIKSPTDPSLRKLLRKTIATLEAFKELVGDVEPQIPENPSLKDRIKDGES